MGFIDGGLPIPHICLGRPTCLLLADCSHTLRVCLCRKAGRWYTKLQSCCRFTCLWNCLSHWRTKTDCRCL